MGVVKNRFSKFILYALQVMDQRGRCAIEKGIAVIQTRDYVQGQKLCRRRGADGYAELSR